MAKSGRVKVTMSYEKNIFDLTKLDYQKIPKIVEEIGLLFVNAGFKIALVGGCVRDLFVERVSPDLDFTTDADVDEIIAIIKPWADSFWDIGRSFGTIGFSKQGQQFEVTTYRVEVYENNSRKPKIGQAASLDNDLVRRDFTINAMALELPNLDFFDPYNGLQDIYSKTLKTPASATKSFSDDPLRMMRAARFVAQLDFSVSAEIVAAMTDMGERIKIVSAERVRDELVKLMLSNNPAAGIDLLVSTGLAEHVLPEISNLKLQTDEHHKHKDVYEHTLMVLRQAIVLETDVQGPVPGPDFVLRFAALMHDVGKPATRKFEPGGVVSFYHHDLVGARLTTKRMRALKFDKETIKAVSRLVELHLRFYGYGSDKWTDSAVRRYVNDAGPLLERLHRLTRSDVTTRNYRKSRRLSYAYDNLELRISQIAAKEELSSLRPGLDGKRIMQILGIPAGPLVGEAYNFLLNIRIDEGVLEESVLVSKLLVWWEQQK